MRLASQRGANNACNGLEFVQAQEALVRFFDPRAKLLCLNEFQIICRKFSTIKEKAETWSNLRVSVSVLDACSFFLAFVMERSEYICSLGLFAGPFN